MTENSALHEKVKIHIYVHMYGFAARRSSTASGIKKRSLTRRRSAGCNGSFVRAGYPVSVDGVFGSKQNCPAKFQISCELRPDGIAKFEELGKSLFYLPGSFHV